MVCPLSCLLPALRTIRIFSSAVKFRRIYHLISQTIDSGELPCFPVIHSSSYGFVIGNHSLEEINPCPNLADLKHPWRLNAYSASAAENELLIR